MAVVPAAAKNAKKSQPIKHRWTFKEYHKYRSIFSAYYSNKKIIVFSSTICSIWDWIQKHQIQYGEIYLRTSPFFPRDVYMRMYVRTDGWVKLCIFSGFVKIIKFE